MRIFWKQLLLHLGTLIISFVLLAVILTQGIRGHLTEQKIAELTTLAQRVAHSMENFAAYGLLNLPLLTTEIINIQQYTDATVMIVGNNFDVLVPVEADLWLDSTQLFAVMQGSAIVVTIEDPHPMLVVGYPYRFGGQVAGAALVRFSMAELENAIAEMYRLTLIALGGIGALAFLLIYFSSRAISRPLSQMNEAAGVIAAGDFDKRLPIHSSDEVGELAQQFNLMAESLQQQERVRREFVANLSHDMRSPLTSMRGFLTALGDGTIPPQQQPRYLNIIMDESERLLNLANNLLDIHQIQEAGVKLHKSQFDINDLIRKTVLGFEKRALDKRIMISSRFAHTSDMVSADEDKISRVISNLLDNALKFTPDGGEITVETTINSSDTKLTVSVGDNGRGMTEEEQRRVFERFYKGDQSRNEDKMGSGLGLSIVKEFVRAHGGSVRVKSAVGVGSSFAFSLELG